MPVFKFTITASLLGLAAAFASPASALTIDTDKYFAYMRLPGKGPMITTYILLSNAKCEAKGRIKGSKKAAYKDVYSERHGCWNEHGKIVVVCPSTTERGELGNACISISTSRFMETASLPRGAF